MTDFETLRTTMVETQLRPVDVRDPRLLKAFAYLPREKFLPDAVQGLAYLDRELHFPNSPRFMLAPATLARLLQLADIQDEEHVLDVGCATGYSTALIGLLAGSVVGLEEDGALIDEALRHSPLPENAQLARGPLNEGHVDGGPYDVILFEGAVQHIPDTFALQLRPKGRLIAVLGGGRAARATVFRNSDNGLLRHAAFDIGAPALPGFLPEAKFQFAI